MEDARPYRSSPPSLPCRCHLSSGSPRKAHDYNVSIWKRLHWGYRLTHSRFGPGSGRPPVFRRCSSPGSFTDKPALVQGAVTAVCDASAGHSGSTTLVTGQLPWSLAWASVPGSWRSLCSPGPGLLALSALSQQTRGIFLPWVL